MKNTLQTFKQNFVNGALIDGTMLVDVDCNCDNVIIPDDTEFVYKISRELDLSKVKKMTVHSVEFLNALTLGFVKQFPKHIVIDCAAMITDFRRQYGASLITTAILKVFYCQGVEYVDIINHDNYKTIDGIMYAQGGTILCQCPKSRRGEVKVPEGTMYIQQMAFSGCQIESIELPDSLKDIGRYAFENCKELKKVKLGNGVTIIGNGHIKGIFAGCKSLKHIDIPSQVNIIGEEAFANSGIETITLHEGLHDIRKNAFVNCKSLEEIILPESVDYIEQNALPNIRRINASRYDNLNIIRSFNFGCTEYEDENLPQMVILNIGKKSVVIPRCMDTNDARSVNILLWKYFNEKEDIDIANKVNHLYTYASTVDDQQNIAIEMIKRNPKDMTTRKFIRESSDNIISRMKHDKNEKGLVDMVKLEFIKNESLHQMLQFAENEHLSALTAYILGTINNDKAQKEIQKKKLSL